MSEKPKQQFDFLNKLANSGVDAEAKVGVEVAPEPVPAEQKFKHRREKHVPVQRRRVNLGWATDYYGNDPDNPKQ